MTTNNSVTTSITESIHVMVTWAINTGIFGQDKIN